MLKKVLLSSVFLCSLISVPRLRAQDKLKFHAGADIVSAYVWRGVFQDGFSIQPEMSLGYKNFYAKGWASADMKELIEMCWYVGYKDEHFDIYLSDVWVRHREKQGVPKYFDYKMHHSELKVAYTISRRVPLQIGWYTRLFGPDYDYTGRKLFSSYLEVNYAFSISGFDMYGVVGAAPWQAVWFGDDSPGFHVTNVGFGAARSIRVIKDYSIAVKTQFSYCPALNQVNFVLGLTI